VIETHHLLELEIDRRRRSELKMEMMKKLGKGMSVIL